MLRRSPDYEQRWSHGQILWSPKGFFEDLITYQSSLFPGKLINIKKCKKKQNTHTQKTTSHFLHGEIVSISHAGFIR